jgi:hypothetical protein
MKHTSSQENSSTAAAAAQAATATAVAAEGARPALASPLPVVTASVAGKVAPGPITPQTTAATAEQWPREAPAAKGLAAVTATAAPGCPANVDSPKQRRPTGLRFVTGRPRRQGVDALLGEKDDQHWRSNRPTLSAAENLGSSGRNATWCFPLIGDTANAAARVEQLTKTTGDRSRRPRKQILEHNQTFVAPMSTVSCVAVTARDRSEAR